MVNSSIEFQQPVLGVIENLASKVDKRIDKLESRLLRIEVVVYGIFLPVLYIGYRVTSMST